MQRVSNSLPKYVQLTEAIIRDIASGQLLDGERLPSEQAMAKNLGVSVGTLRKSLKALVEKKMLKQIQGSGNYISYVNKVSSIYSMFRLELIRGGGLPTAKVISVVNLTKPKKLPAFGISNKGTRIRRLRYLNDIAVALEEIWLDSGAGVLNMADLNDAIYHVYKNKLGIWISRVEDRVSVKSVPEWSPTNFGVPIDTVTGFIERFGWASSKHPIEYSRTWFDCDKAHYVQRFK